MAPALDLRVDEAAGLDDDDADDVPADADAPPAAGLDARDAPCAEGLLLSHPATKEPPGETNGNRRDTKNNKQNSDKEGGRGGSDTEGWDVTRNRGGFVSRY